MRYNACLYLVLENQGVSKGVKPIYYLTHNDTRSKNTYDIGLRISTVIRIFYHFLFIFWECGKTPVDHAFILFWGIYCF